jgi:hypothetical protein
VVEHLHSLCESTGFDLLKGCREAGRQEAGGREGGRQEGRKKMSSDCRKVLETETLNHINLALGECSQFVASYFS